MPPPRLSLHQRKAWDFISNMLKVRGCAEPIMINTEIPASQPSQPKVELKCTLHWKSGNNMWITMSPPYQLKGLNVKVLMQIIALIQQNPEHEQVNTILWIVPELTAPARTSLKNGSFQGYRTEIFTYDECLIPKEAFLKHYLQPIRIRKANELESTQCDFSQSHLISEDNALWKFFGFHAGQGIVVEDSSRVAGITTSYYLTAASNGSAPDMPVESEDNALTLD